MVAKISIIECLCNDLRLDVTYVKKILDRSEYYYKTYSIPKKNGGSRLIQQPSAELKTIQYWIIENIIRKYSVSNYAYAYRKKKSIKMMVDVHKNRPFILKVDVKNFFGSITDSHITQMVKTNDSIKDIPSDQIIVFLKEACLFNDTLSMGAVSSPAISNAVMYNFDRELATICEKYDYLYTRYSDDMYISSTCKIPTQILSEIDTLLKKYSLKRNKEKTKFMCIGMNRSLTGLCITENGNVTIGKKRKQNIKRMIYQKFQHEDGVASVILGYLNYIKDVEPLYYDRLILKYAEKYGDIITLLKEEVISID